MEYIENEGDVLKLYNHKQLLIYSIVSAAIATVLTFFLSVLLVGRTPNGTNSPEKSQNVDWEPPQRETELVLPIREGDGYSEDELENIRIYERLNSAVVHVTTQTVTLSWFLEPVPREGGTGSGSIIDERGFILTNYHVVENAFKVFVSLSDGSQHEGEVIGKDPENDLAVIKFDPVDRVLVTIPFGASNDLKVGQKVLAIGNPFALERTLTTGIVSGLGRPVRGANRLVIRDMIQTDASINQGNSGGPLINARGEMIGVNTMIYSPSGGSVGIGFAVPVDTARRVVPDLIAYGTVKRGWIEIYPVQLNPWIVRSARLPISSGVLISEVERGGNADKAGLKGGSPSRAYRSGRSIIYLGGDIIVEIEGSEVSSISDLFGALESTKPGQEIELVVIRNGKEKTVRLNLSERPEDIVWY